MSKENQLDTNRLHYQSIEDDENYTFDYGVKILLPYIQHLKNKIIWCPFDKKWSSFCRILSEDGFKVVYSHIDDGCDFFKGEPPKWDIIISNPPYKNKRKFIERCLDLGKPFALLLPITVLNDAIMNDVAEKYNKNFQLLMPRQRMEFYNFDREINNRPSFKAVYFGFDIFQKDLIMLKENEMNKRDTNIEVFEQAKKEMIGNES